MNRHQILIVRDKWVPSGRQEDVASSPRELGKEADGFRPKKSDSVNARFGSREIDKSSNHINVRPTQVGTVVIAKPAVDPK